MDKDNDYEVLIEKLNNSQVQAAQDDWDLEELRQVATDEDVIKKEEEHVSLEIKIVEELRNRFAKVIRMSTNQPDLFFKTKMSDAGNQSANPEENDNLKPS